MKTTDSILSLPEPHFNLDTVARTARRQRSYAAALAGAAADLEAPWVPLARANGGVGKENVSNPDGYVIVQIPANILTLKGDDIFLYWGNPDRPVDSHSVTDEDKNLPISMRVPTPDILRVGDGIVDVWYVRISRTPQETELKSASVTIVVKTTLPGGDDPDPINTPYLNENLGAPSITPTGVIDKEAARKGVKVTVQPWANMFDGDALTVYWGGHKTVPRTITTAEIGRPVDVLIDGQVILDEGDSNNLLVYYSITDIVSQWSRYSNTANVEVEASNDEFAPPEIVDADKGILDKDLLGTEDAGVIVYVNGTMSAGDIVQLNFAGISDDGRKVTEQSIGTVREGHSSIQMKISNDVLARVAPGNATLYYRVFDSESKLKGRSRRAEVRVNGTEIPLPAPKVAEAEGGVLDPAKAADGAHVRIDEQLDLAAYDEVFWVWNGTTADDRSDLVTKTQIIQPGEEHTPLTFTVSAENVERIAGGRVEIYYRITRGDTQKESSRTVLTIAGEGRLVRPKVDGVEGSVLYLSMVPDGANVTIFPWEEMSFGDRVDWSWTGQTPTGSANGTRTVDKSEVDLPLKVKIERTVLEADASTEEFVTVSYTVTRIGSTTPQPSARTRFTVAPSPEVLLPAPSVDGVTGTDLDPTTLPASGATVRIGRYEGKAPGDEVFVWFGRGTGLGEHSQYYNITQKTVNDDITMLVPKAVVEAHRNGQVNVQYTVTRYADAKDVDSKILVLNVRAQSKWPAPSVDEAKGDYFDPADIPYGATIRIHQNDEMQSGDTITMHWGAANGDIPPYDDSIPVRNPRDYTFSMPANELQLWNRRIVPVSYIVDRATQAFPSDTLRLRVGIGDPDALPAPIIPEAHDGILDPSNLPSGKATATIPVEAGLVAGDYVVMTWGGGDASGGRTWLIPVTSKTEGTAISREITSEYITPFLNKTTTLFYTVDDGAAMPRVSQTLTVSVEYQDMVLAMPEVPDANNGILDPRGITGEGAKVYAPYNTGMSYGDIVRLHWDCTIAAGTFEAPATVDRGTGDIEFTVPLNKLYDGANGNVAVWYEWRRGTNRLGASPKLDLVIKFSDLPIATIDEAQGRTLDPRNLSAAGATVRLASSGHFKFEDKIELHWIGETDEGSDTILHSVSVKEAGEDVTIQVSKSVVEANDGTTVALDYIVTRKADSRQENSANSYYDIRTELGVGNLRVMGARAHGGTHRASGGAQYLTALNKSNNQALLAGWCYEDEKDWTTQSSFKDTRPWVPLLVRSASDQVTINPVNIFGTGADTTTYKGRSALAARVQTTVGWSVCGWGNTSYGGSPGSVTETLDDIAEISSTSGAFCARRVNGGVIAWGDTTLGGAIPDNLDLSGTKRVFGNGGAFVAVSGSGNVGKLSAWGNSGYGGILTDPAKQLTDVVKVASSGMAFCALRRNNQVVAWGDNSSGGTLPSDIARLDTIVDVRGNYTAFCVLQSNGSVVAWGAASDGGLVPSAITERRDIMELASASARAFAVRTKNKGVLAWGNKDYGGTIPNDILSLNFTDIEEVTATWGAFCARRANGTVIVWGDKARGGDFPSTLSDRNNNIVQVVGTGQAFAALRSDGTVIAWPSNVDAGNTSSVALQLVNIRAIYANSEVFVAVKDSGGVVTWGVADGGADSSKVATRLNQQLSYERR
ncbi:hypothetical protein CN878_23380 [Ochrobactrum sp. 695/2009]|nr:hypothetical protein [Brucella intermedia]PJR92010.1 hypothetical protein CN881_10540 [Ochrobactrum sp. 721/2009]PJT15070.1 hypothetical protein CN880_17345 [Ochrobactrum sp. 720/2009]PJT18097.1 hypothetical protein CN879_23550 [Ochrobactrum sp. 715/2009]PJT23027.1 hypothetical protein CN878_23380 [Ochrobactrum sp. 695/2009]PJT32683.1 hypothetical protein CN877_20675 [Ochrobactrum sp. 689/2009]